MADTRPLAALSSHSRVPASRGTWQILCCPIDSSPLLPGSPGFWCLAVKKSVLDFLRLGVLSLHFFAFVQSIYPSFAPRRPSECECPDPHPSPKLPKAHLARRFRLPHSLPANLLELIHHVFFVAYVPCRLQPQDRIR